MPRIINTPAHPGRKYFLSTRHARRQRPQFVMLRVREGGSASITIADYDRAAGTITIVVQEVAPPPSVFAPRPATDLDVAGARQPH